MASLDLLHQLWFPSLSPGTSSPVAPVRLLNQSGLDFGSQEPHCGKCSRAPVSGCCPGAPAVRPPELLVGALQNLGSPSLPYLSSSWEQPVSVQGKLGRLPLRLTRKPHSELWCPQVPPGQSCDGNVTCLGGPQDEQCPPPAVSSSFLRSDLTLVNFIRHWWPMDCLD